ncbi:MAG: hypothetical protein HXX10_26080 [Rhodoplanes sp.]|uniref:hypothetical protein n=1 Tax=Rhodoplanes sp. TaxID=1968906 RepID=UPI00181200D1|nr:hypothetical protein [Rhodoplanes sp.]NVO17511.1 hypothetical protein [Rhodoplanes sp.]
MTAQELQDLVVAIDRVTAEHAATPERPRRFLEDEGFFDQDGKVAKPHRSGLARSWPCV